MLPLESPQLQAKAQGAGQGGAPGGGGSHGNGSGEHGVDCPQQKELVQAFVNRFNRYWRTGNASLVATLYDPFAAFVNIVGPAVLYGRQNITGIIEQFQTAYPQFTDHLDSTLGTQDCEYIVKNGHFTIADNNPNTFLCLMVLKKQPVGSAEPYLVIRDDIKWP